MKILSLCFCNNYFEKHENTLIDLKNGSDVLDLPSNFGEQYDFIFAAPPCDQFTKANSHHWEDSPVYYVKVARKCFEICALSKKPWIMENPPGRISKFIPALMFYRRLTFQDPDSNKEYILYSNEMLLQSFSVRYGKKNIHPWNKSIREMWTPGLVNLIKYNFNL